MATSDPIIVTALFCKNDYYFLMNNGTVTFIKGIIQTNIAEATIINDKIYLTNFDGDNFELVTDQASYLQYSITGLPFEILDMIYDQLDLTSQINFRLTSRKFSKFPLTNFWDLSGSFAITNEIIEKNPFIRKLDLSRNTNIYCVANLIYLKRLNIINSKVKSLSNLPNLEMIILNDDAIKIPSVDKLKIVRLSKYYTDHLPIKNIYDYFGRHCWFDSHYQSERAPVSVMQPTLSKYLTKPTKKINFRNYDRYHSFMQDRKNRSQKTSKMSISAKR